MTQESTHLGKTAGKDLASVKATWPAVHGVSQSLQEAHRLINSAFAYLEPYGEHAAPLKSLAMFLVERTN